MKCPYCGGEVQNGERYCRACGGEIQLSQQIQPQAQQSEALSYPSPALQLPTNRGLLKTIPLCLITLGIYGTVMQSRISTEIKLVASRYDGRRTMPFLEMLMLAPLTLGIYGFVWQHQLADRVGAELRRRNDTYSFSASSFWLWQVLGSLIVVGPFVYQYKLLKAMNMLNASCNLYG